MKLLFAKFMANSRKPVIFSNHSFCLAYCMVLLLASVVLPGCSHEPGGPLYKVADKSYKSITAAVTETIDSQIFLVGEHHDNPRHHAHELELIREIHEKAEKPLAIGLEMFETGYQEQLDEWVHGNLGLDDFIKIYYANWDQPWSLYRDIFFYAREHGIHLIGLNIPRKIVHKVARSGYASLTAQDMSSLPAGLACDVTPEYESFIHKVFGWHNDTNESFTNFCEAQVLWDSVMAINLLKFNRENPATKLVVLAGDGHSWKPGIPRQISLRQDLSMAIFLPESRKLNRGNVSPKETDYLWLIRSI